MGPGVAVISLNRSEARNAIGAEMLRQLHSIVQGMRHGTSARVLIVCSTVPGVFCAGADLKVSVEDKSSLLGDPLDERVGKCRLSIFIMGLIRFTLSFKLIIQIDNTN